MNYDVAVVAGHAVKGPSLVSIGGGGRWMAYACAADALAVCALRATGESDAGTSSDDADFVDSLRVAPLPDAQRAWVVHIHQRKDILCVGTAGDGLYVTSASDPLFRCDATRLPLRATGESIFAACFVDGPDGDGSDALVISSAFREFGRNGARLSVWDVSRASLLWRGCADAAESIAALPGALRFATATRREVALWSAERDGRGAARALTVRSRLCGPVAELRGAEFVSLAAPPLPSQTIKGIKGPEGEKGEKGSEGDEVLTALTAGGFLVAFDSRSGAAQRWMDCKVCPAAAVARAAGGLVVCGALVRLFAADSWEFRGKIVSGGALDSGASAATATSSFLARLADGVCRGVAATGHCAALFCAGGDALRFRLRAAQKGATRWSFGRVYHYAAPAPNEGPLRFFLSPSKKKEEGEGGTSESVCLWSPRCVRCFGVGLRPKMCVAMDTTCAARHEALGVLALYDAAQYEVVVMPFSLRAVLCRAAVGEPLVSLAAGGRDALAGLSPDGCLFRFIGEWADGAFALRPLPPQRLAAHTAAAPLLHLAAAGGAFFAASSCAVVRIDGTREEPIAVRDEHNSDESRRGNSNGISQASDDILALASAGDVLIIVRSSGCTLLDVTSRAPSVVVSVPPPQPPHVFALRDAVPAADARVIALCGEAEVAVVRTDDGACVWRRAAPGCRAVGLAPNSRAVFLCDAAGTVAVWPVPPVPPQRRPTRERRHQQHHLHTKQEKEEQKEKQKEKQRARSCGGGPTSGELQSRYRDLHGFYETTRRAPVQCGSGSSSSGVLFLPRGDSVVQPLPRRWESAGAPTELPQAPSSAEKVSSARASPCAVVSASIVDVSALTSVDITASLRADIRAQECAKVTFAEAPAHGVRSPARKGAAAKEGGPLAAQEDDVVNVESLDEMERRTRAEPSLAASCARERSFELRNGLRELAELCERQSRDEEDAVSGANEIDEETVEDLFASVSRLYAVLQSRQQERNRPGSARSNVSDTSMLSVNMVMAELQRLQLQSSRIESQNQEILSKLQKR